jgi:hypothetical protein
MIRTVATSRDAAVSLFSLGVQAAERLPAACSDTPVESIEELAASVRSGEVDPV